MAQFLRPNSTLSTTGTVNIIGASTAHEAIDEITSDTTDRIQQDNTNAIASLSLSAPSTPQSGTCTLRWTAVRVDARSGGTSLSTDGTGIPTLLVIFADYITSTVYADKTTSLPSGNDTYSDSLTFDTSIITDWNSLGVRFDFTRNGGGGNLRHAGTAWIELEIPDPAAAPVTRYILIT